jgi:hypothetical protein
VSIRSLGASAIVSPSQAKKKARVARAVLLGFGVLLLLMAYVGIRIALGEEARDQAMRAAPVAFVVGALLGSGLWVVDRLYPRLLRGATSTAVYAPTFLVIALLMLLTPSGLWLAMIGFAGMAAPVATPLARFGFTSTSESPTSEAQKDQADPRSNQP